MTKIAILAVLSVLPYLTSIHLPFISDDYEQIARARQYGAPSQWPELLRDPLYRCRATSLILTRATEAAVGLHPAAYRATALVLHFVSVLAVLWLARLAGASPNVALFAAAFFAVHEGHQEAVIWYAAIHELFVFPFAAGVCGSWILWRRSGRPVWYAASLGCFVAALASKESAVAVVPLLALMAWKERRWGALAPFAVLSVAYFAASWTAAGDHLHFNDGTFSLRSNFVWNWANSVGRLFWIWGVLAAAVLAATGEWRRHRGLLTAALLWVACSLAPYSFLTYMDRVPSRHTYLASGGLALVVGVAFASLAERRKLAASVAMAIVLHNAGYVWWKKQPQYARRAEPTEQLIRFAREHKGGFSLDCFPYSDWVALRAVQVGASLPPSIVRPAGTPAEARFCYDGKL
ncbi:MAG TPA: hypothetical protein DEH78_11380 [Solibacterales bacterium]|nr:hypothetical protein [Bryobacterales bacterium]